MEKRRRLALHEGMTVEGRMREAMARRKTAPWPQQAAREDNR